MRRVRLGVVVLALTLGSTCAAALAETFDIVIRGGVVIDGTGLPRYSADVGIARGHIAKVGDLQGDQAGVSVDARGLFVVPGFINIHSHPEEDTVSTAENMLTQGITTEIDGPDGWGSPDIASQARKFSAKGLAANLGFYVGFNEIWKQVVGNSDRRATSAEVDTMRAQVQAGLEAGAWGLSAGLDYKPGYFADRDEVIAIAAAARSWRTNFPNHERLTPEAGYSSLTGIRETVDIGEASGVTAVITHMKAQGTEQLRSQDILDLMDAATRRGHYVAADLYPYLAGANNVRSLLLPGWALQGGEDALYERFKTPELRARIAGDIDRVMQLRFGGPSGVRIASLQKELTQYMAEWAVSGGEAIIRLNEQYRGKLPTTVLRFGAEEDLVRMLRHPNVSVACDCGASLSRENQHPRYFGTFPRVLGRYIREQGVLTWEDGIRKMSGLPAATIGTIDRGLLAAGMAADVVMFDPATVIDKATYESAKLSEGVRYVLINGVMTVRDGKVTGEQGGQVILRNRSMPTRPMTPDRGRSVSGTVTVRDAQRNAALQIQLDIAQSAGLSRARGFVKVLDSAGQIVFETSELGFIQAEAHWASVTGSGHLETGERRSFTLVVDGADATQRGDRAVSLTIDGFAMLHSRELDGVVMRVEGER